MLQLSAKSQLSITATTSQAKISIFELFFPEVYLNRLQIGHIVKPAVYFIRYRVKMEDMRCKFSNKKVSLKVNLFIIHRTEEAVDSIVKNLYSACALTDKRIG